MGQMSQMGQMGQIGQVDHLTCSRSPTMDDPLSDNSKGLQWDQGQGCTFTGGAYHVSNPQSSGSQACMAHKSYFSNFLYQVQMTIVKGSYGSLIFRSDNAVSNFYIFRMIASRKTPATNRQ
jgi:hypothetical protein